MRLATAPAAEDRATVARDPWRSINPVEENVMRHSTRLQVAMLALALSAMGCGNDVGDALGARCDEVAECGGITPFCAEGTCVQCTAASDCDGDRVCEDGLCSECSESADCPADEPICDRSGLRGRCVECGDNDDCGVADPACVDGECEASCVGVDICEDDELCSSEIGGCVECEENADCPAEEPLCDGFECFECESDDDCGASAPYCINGDCRECIQNTDCPAGESCNGELECSGG